MHHISPELLTEFTSRMAASLFRGLDFRELGYGRFADLLESRIPNEMEEAGVDPVQISEVVIRAAGIVYGAIYDLSDERMQMFTEGQI